MSNFLQVIQQFIQYIIDWEDLTDKKWVEFALTQSTATGYKISLAATIELLEYLHEVCNYSYLMTAHLTSNPIEVSIIR